jgi:putative phosphoesterase
MKKIGLISDTHGYLDDAVFTHFRECDEVWHAGDFGSMEIVDQLKAFRPFRGVWGNIDGGDLRAVMPVQLLFQCEEVTVLMQHIGGYPGRYAPGIKATIEQAKPQLFISGHSHILKVMFDDKLQCLHMNPGAAGKHGWHQVRTLIRFEIDGAKMQRCEVIELGKK